jgi:glycosyltransferase involved in cell wall biosynthesis
LTGARPKVAFLDHCALESGAELALLRLLPALVDIDPVVIVGEDGPLVDALRRHDIPVRIVPMTETTRALARGAVVPGLGAARGALSSLAYAYRLARLLRALEVDLVATNSLKASLYGGIAGRLARRPVVWHVRDRIADDYLPASAVTLIRAAARVLPSAVIANSRATLETLRLPSAVGRRLRARAIGDPCPPDEFAGAPRPDHAGITVGIVGRISPWKGQDVFLRAFAASGLGGEDRARVIGGVLFGEEAYADTLPPLAAELGIADRVEFTGHVTDVAAQLGSLDIAVHASTIPEPFGQVVVEAMAAGVPIVAADAGGPSEIVTDQVDGLLYPRGDVAALAGCLTRLAHDASLRARLADAGRRTARTYAPDAIASQVMATYRAVLSR